MTKEEAIRYLPKPWSDIIKCGGSIDYHCKNCDDHKYMEECGYKAHMNGDCSYTAVEVPAFSLSSYGDWGSFWSKVAKDEEYGYFIDMISKRIIKPWRASVYINGEGYDYEDGNGWSKYDQELNSRLYCPNPMN